MKRKLLNTWRRYASHKSSARKMMNKSRYYYEMRLKQKVINILLRNVKCSNNRKIAILKLKLFYKRLLIISVWNKWTKIIDETNDKELRYKLSVAKSFYEKKIMRNCLKNFNVNKILKQRENQLKMELINLCESFYFKKISTRWRIAYNNKKRFIALEEKASKFYNRSLIWNTLLRWMDYHNSTISMKFNYQKSELHSDNRVMRKCFVSWINFCNEKIRLYNLIVEATDYHWLTMKRKIFNYLSMNIVRKKLKRKKIRIADKFCKTNLISKMFTNWKIYYNNSKILKEKITGYKKNLQNKLKLKIISKWKLYVFEKKSIHKNILISLNYNRTKTWSRSFDVLKKYVVYRIEKKGRLNYLNDGIEAIKLNVLKTYFDKWRIARSIFLKEKCKLFYADEYYSSNLKKRYYNYWRTFLTQRRIKKQRKDRINELLSNFVLKNCLNIWYAKYKISSLTNLNENWAIKIYEMKIIDKHFTAWQYFVDVIKREKLSIKNSKELRERFVIKEGLKHLIKIFLTDKESNYKKNYPMRNVSPELKLLKKYFNNWHDAVISIINNRILMRTIKKIPNNIENEISKNLSINHGKHLSDFFPRFIIPEFMKDEIKLQRGVRRCFNKSQIDDTNGIKISNAFSSLINNGESGKYSSNQSSNNKYQSNITNQLNNSEILTSNIISMMNPVSDLRTKYEKKPSNPIGETSTPLLDFHDSFQPDLDPSKTYTVKNPVFPIASNEIINSSNRQLFDEQKFITVDSLELLPTVSISPINF